MTLEMLESKLDLYFNKKAPNLPENIKESIVKYSPYIAIIVMIMCLPMLLFTLGLGGLLLPLGILGGIGSGFKAMINLVFMVITLAFSIAALPGLFKRTKKSWKLMFYCSLLTTLSNLLTLNLGNLIIGSIISWYFLFQIRSYYKN
jgi:hypothetical protein